MYKVVELKSGRKMFYKDGKLVSRKSIPEGELAALEQAVEEPQIVYADVDTSEERKCLFCGQPGTDPKRINNESVPLCLEHYQTKTTGQVVQKLREVRV